jgi:hypothetical protein
MWRSGRPGNSSRGADAVVTMPINQRVALFGLPSLPPCSSTSVTCGPLRGWRVPINRGMVTGEAISGTGWLVWCAMVGATLEGAVRRVDGAGALNRGNAGLVVTGSIRDGSGLESVSSPPIGLGAARAQSSKTA